MTCASSEQQERRHQGLSAVVKTLIQTQIDKGIRPERIILAGFSQGSVMALEVGLRYEQRSGNHRVTYLHDAARQNKSAMPFALPIFMGHGTADPMIPIMRAATSQETLIRLAYDIDSA